MMKDSFDFNQLLLQCSVQSNEYYRAKKYGNDLFAAKCWAWKCNVEDFLRLFKNGLELVRVFEHHWNSHSF